MFCRKGIPTRGHEGTGKARPTESKVKVGLLLFSVTSLPSSPATSSVKPQSSPAKPPSALASLLISAEGRAFHVLWKTGLTTRSFGRRLNVS